MLLNRGRRIHSPLSLTQIRVVNNPDPLRVGHNKSRLRPSRSLGAGVPKEKRTPPQFLMK